MKIIVLKGTHSCGKTTTLNTVYKKIIENDGEPTCYKQEGANKYDFSDIIIFNGKKVAYLTMGDMSRRIVNGVRNYYADKCDLFVCAFNKHLKNPPKEFSKHDTHFIIKTKNDSNYDKHNTKSAEEVYGAIIQNLSI